MYHQMLRIREFEERVKRTFLDHPGVIRGHTHLADGAEASIVGSIATLGPEDQFFATYRCHGYPIVRGTDVKAMMAEIYGRRDGLCKGIGGSMHLTDVSNGFLGTSGIVGAGIPHAAGAAWAAQIRKDGQVVLLLLRRRRLEAGRVRGDAQHRLALEAADRVRDGEQRLQRRTRARTRRTRIARTARISRSRRRRTACPASRSTAATRSRCTRRSVQRWRGRAAGDGPTLVESQMYRLSAHGNIIAPPGVPLHFPEHEAIEKFGNPEEYEAAKQGDPVPAFRGRLVAEGTMTADGGRRAHRRRQRRDAGRGRLRPREPVPGRRIGPRIHLRLEGGDEHGTRTALHRRHQRGDHARDGAGRHRPLLRPEHGDDRERAVRRCVRQGPRPRDADLRDGRDRHRRSAPHSPATGPWSSSTWPSSCSLRWTRSSTRATASAR